MIEFFRILRLTEGGFVNRWRSKHWPSSSCSSPRDKIIQSNLIHLDDVTDTLLFLSVGIAIATVVLLLEICASALVYRVLM